MLDEDHGPDEAPEQPEKKDAARPQKGTDREALLRKRRARQTSGSKSKRSRMLTSAGLLGVAAAIFGVSIGFDGMFGAADDAGQQASKVDLTVVKETDQPSQLDFVVPGRPADTTASAAGAAATDLERKLKDLEEQLAKANGRRDAELRRRLAEETDKLNEKFEAERKEMAKENARLREQFAQADEQQQLAKRQRESQSVVIDEGQGSSVGAVAAGGAAAGAPDDLNANERFLQTTAADDEARTSVSRRLSDPSRTVVQGTIISAVLETAINTELPGSIRAQVTRPVYSFDGTRELMPAGTIVIGQFNNNVDLAQKRVLIAWNRAITPDGKSIALGGTGTDMLGRSGTRGNVNNRYGVKFGASVLISALSAGPAILADRLSTNSRGGSPGTTINIGTGGGGSGGGSGGDALGAVGNAISKQSGDVLKKYLDLPPVIRIPQGEEIRIFANRDLVFL